MPQRILIFYVCSLCNSETQDPSELSKYHLTGNKLALEYDVCEGCKAEDKPFAKFLAMGTSEKELKKGTPVANAESFACDYCDKVVGTSQGLSSHLSRMHNVKPNAKATAASSRAQLHVCPEDECEFSAATPQAVGIHRRHTHDYKGPKAKTA